MSAFDPAALMSILQSQGGGSSSPSPSTPPPPNPSQAVSDAGQGSQRIIGIKSYLGNILHGVGEQAKSTVGMPTEDEQNQMDSTIAARKQDAAQQGQQIQSDIMQRAQQVKQLQSPVTLPNGMQLPFALARPLIAVQAQASGKPYMVVPNVGLYDTQAGKLTPDDINAGIKVTQPIAQHFGLPLQAVGQKVPLGVLAQREQAQAAQPTVPGLNVPGQDNSSVAGLSDLARPSQSRSQIPQNLQVLQYIKEKTGTLPPEMQAMLDKATAPPIGAVPGAQPQGVQDIPSSLIQPQGGQIPQSAANNAAVGQQPTGQQPPFRLAVVNGNQVLVGANGQPVGTNGQPIKKPGLFRTFLQGYANAEQARLGIPTDLQKQNMQSEIALRNAETQHLLNPLGSPNASKLEFDTAGNLIGFRDARGNLLGPNNPNLTPDMKDMLDSAQKREHSPTTPEGQVMADLTKSGLTPAQAYQKIQEMKGANKPDTAVEHKQQFEGIIQKAIAHADGAFDPEVMTDLKREGIFIRDSKGLTDPEKQFALSYLATNGSPAAIGSASEKRGSQYAQSRPVNVLDTFNGNRPETINMDQLNEANALTPGRYISATGGARAIDKKNLMEDIKGASDNMSTAIDNLKADFPADMRFKLTLALKSRDPQSAVSALLASEAVNKMTPDQQDYLIALNQVVENAMAMRSMLGAGQGSEDVRHAISNTLPGLITANKGFAKKQMAAFIAQQDRLSRGIPDVPLNTGGNRSANTPAPSANNAPVSLAGDIKPGERTATGPNGDIVFRGGKWIDPKTGNEVK